MKHELYELKQMQMLPLSVKLLMTQRRIRDWYEYWQGNVYVSISGKDSTVLLDIVRKMYPDVLAVYVDTGLEYPEVKELAMSHENVKVLHPKKPFWQVVRDEGYPIISKEVSECINNARQHLTSGGYDTHWRKIQGIGEFEAKKKRFSLEKYKPLLDVPFRISNKCCSIMKKNPAHQFNKESGLHPMTGQMADESNLRLAQWLKNGCNGFDMKEPISNPMSFWTEQDVLQYIKENNVKIPTVYGEVINDSGFFEDAEQLSMCPCGKLKTTGCKRTGCVYCPFGAHLEKGKTRFQRLKETHPKLYNYCMDGGEFDSEGMWIPNQKGLGLRFVFETINKIYGEGFIRYE